VSNTNFAGLGKKRPPFRRLRQKSWDKSGIGETRAKCEVKEMMNNSLDGLEKLAFDEDAKVQDTEIIFDAFPLSAEIAAGDNFGGEIGRGAEAKRQQHTAHHYN